MNRALHVTRIARLIGVAAIGTLAACSGSESGEILGVDPTDSAAEMAAAAPAETEGSFAGEADAAALAGEADGSEIRLEARLNPRINVDASGKARSENAPGTADDRFDSQVEIAKADFGRLGIDPGDGFADEVVRLVVLRDGTQIFARRMAFSENRPADITFELDIRGAPAPEIRAGDVARVFVNGRFTLRGVFRRA